MPPFDIRGARGRGNPRPRRRTRKIPTHLYTPLTGAGRRSTPRRVVMRNHRAVVTRQPYRPNPKRVISHRRVQALQRNAKRKSQAREIMQAHRTKIPGAGRILATKRRAERQHSPYSRFTPQQLADHFPTRNRHIAASIPGVFPVAKATYEGYNRDLWDRARDLYPSNTMPTSHVLPLGDPSQATPLFGVTGHRWKGSRGHKARVTYSPGVALSHLLRQGSTRDFAATVPLHEWAHTFQRASKNWPEWEAEGAAEAFEQEAALALGLRSSTNRKYAGYVRKVRRRKSRPFVSFDQFR